MRSLPGSNRGEHEVRGFGHQLQATVYRPRSTGNRFLTRRRRERGGAEPQVGHLSLRHPGRPWFPSLSSVVRRLSDRNVAKKRAGHHEITVRPHFGAQ